MPLSLPNDELVRLFDDEKPEAIDKNNSHCPTVMGESSSTSLNPGAYMAPT